MTVSGLVVDSSALIHLHRPKQLLGAHRCNVTASSGSDTVHFVTRWIPTTYFQHSFIKYNRTKCAASSAGRGYQELRFNDETRSDPFGLSLIKEVIWTLRSLIVFLVEQPRQLRYIEWPSFGNTLKTATLTLVLVMFLIVALASIDSALSYILAWLLRRAA